MLHPKEPITTKSGLEGLKMVTLTFTKDYTERSKTFKGVELQNVVCSLKYYFATCFKTIACKGQKKGKSVPCDLI